MTIQEDWDRAAQAYEVFSTADDSYSKKIEWPAIKALLPELRGKKVLDIGCGTGIYTFLLEQYDPSAIRGIDLSDGMLEIAREKAHRLQSHAAFCKGDAACEAAYRGEKYDLIFSSTTSHYVADLPKLFDSLRRHLADDGCIILSAIHPVYSAQYPVGQGDAFPGDEQWQMRYLDRRERAYIQPWIEWNDACEKHLSRSCHHTMGDYSNAIHEAGLHIEKMLEPLPPAEWADERPDRYEDCIETPLYLILKLTRR